MDDETRADTRARGQVSAIAIVPARLSSTRLPRKMLLRETGHYLFEHTARNAERAPSLQRTVVATDSEEIVRAADEVGVEALLTSEHHPSGTDRVNEATQRLLGQGHGPWDVVVNIQGDEPELPIDAIEMLVAAFAPPEVEVATLCSPIESREEALDPSVVKVVRDSAGDALYFSRSPIPSLDHPSRPMREGAPGLSGLQRHVGVYAFRPGALERFCALAPGDLEATESLEQLRWLERGGKMRVIEIARLGVGIDTMEHYAAFCERHRDRRPLEGINSP